jgi:hypothetical protein
MMRVHITVVHWRSRCCLQLITHISMYSELWFDHRHTQLAVFYLTVVLSVCTRHRNTLYRLPDLRLACCLTTCSSGSQESLTSNSSSSSAPLRSNKRRNSSINSSTSSSGAGAAAAAASASSAISSGGGSPRASPRSKSELKKRAGM